MKDTTFGDSDAAKTLAKIIFATNNRTLIRNVSSFWSNYVHGVNEICCMRDKQVAHSLLILWKNNAIKRASERFYGEVATYLTNIVVAKFRDRLERIK